MRFLLEQDVYRKTANLLVELKHDVVTAASIGMSNATDAELLDQALSLNRIMVTCDRDYGSLVFQLHQTKGVIYLRISPLIVDAVHRELARILSLYSETKLQKSFVVIEADRHRIRNLPQAS